MLKKETNPAEAVYPDTGIEILSEDIIVNYNTTPSGTIAGNRSKNLRPIKNKIEPIEGSVEMLVEPKTFGHLLTGVLGEGTDSTLEADTVWQHLFEPANVLQTYTIDVKLAGEDFVKRFIGTRISKAEFSIDENKWKVTIGIMAQKAFTNARVASDVSSGTDLLLDQTTGLTTNDTLTILNKTDPDTEIADLTVATITDENTLVVSTISDAITEDDIVVIAAQTPSFDLSKEFIWAGGAKVFIANGQHGMQNLSTASNIETFELSIVNELDARYSATGNNVIDRFSSAILLKGIEITGKFSKYFENPNFIDMLREDEQLALRFDFLGVKLSDNAESSASATIETDGTDTISITVDTAGEDGNDYAVVFTEDNASLSASLSSKLITVNLDTVGANNTTTLVASAINGLSGISTTDTGTDLVDTASNVSKIYFADGRDANEIEKLRFNLPNIRLNPFGQTLGNDDTIVEEIEFVAYRDENDEREIEIMLRNDTSSY